MGYSEPFIGSEALASRVGLPEDHAQIAKLMPVFAFLMLVAVAALLPVWRDPASFTKDQLRSIKAPTLVGDGDHDEVIELAQIKEMATLIPNGKLAVLPDTSHFAMWQDPAAFNKVLVEFLSARP